MTDTKSALQETGRRVASPPVLSIIGRSGAGKTSLIEHLIPELKRRGYRIGTVKHHVHGDFEIDIPGKDSWRHTQAGSTHAVIVAEHKVATIQQVDLEPKLTDVVHRMGDVDIVLAEGFHWESQHKIEVLRGERSHKLLEDPGNLIAIVTDVEGEFNAPTFSFAQVGELADFFLGKLFLQ